MHATEVCARFAHELAERPLPGPVVHHAQRAVIGWFAALCPGPGRAMSDGPDWSQLGATLGANFHIARLGFKNHVGFGHTFAAIDGALALQPTHGLGHADIAAVHLGVYRPTLDNTPHVDPQTADQACFSLHCRVASALVHGSVRLSAFEPARLYDPATRALLARIRALPNSDTLP